MKILTVPAAKEEIRRLQKFINLAESYEASDIQKWIIKEYAYTSSIREVVIRAKNRGIKANGVELDHEFVKSVIASIPKNDELHRLVRANYKLRIKRS